MNEPTSNQTLDIQGTVNSHRKYALWMVCGVVATGIIGILLLFSGMETGEVPGGVFLLFSFVFALSLAFTKQPYVYMDFSDRQIVTVERYAGFETSKRCRPLTDFSHIVVRHLCHSEGEGPDTYTDGVGLKPVDGKAVLWVKNFPTTQDEVPRTAYEFARELQELTGLPVAPMGESKSETH